MVYCAAFPLQYTRVHWFKWKFRSAALKLFGENVEVFEWVLFPLKFLDFFQSTNFPNLS